MWERMRKLSLNGLKAAAWAGVVGPALFVLVFTLEGALRPAYDPRAMFISALSLGPRGWLQIANFLQLGLLMLLFTRAVTVEFGSCKGARAGLTLLTLLALLFFVSGPFVMDPAGTPPDQMTFHGLVHGLAGGIVFLLMPVVIFIFLSLFRRHARWQAFAQPTLALGLFDAAAVLFFTLSSKLPQLQIVFSGWMGLIQRTALVPFMLWLFLFGLGMLRRVISGGTR
jgi:hypothetical protein